MTNSIKLEFMSLSENEALARAVAAAFIAPLDPTIEALADVRTAVSEAVTNAIIHGYKRRVDGVVSMECERSGDLVSIKVRDLGCGIEDVPLAMQPFYTTGPDGERSGMGFAVMGAFMDSLEVESAPGSGTLVTMRKRICSADEGAEGEA